MRRSELGKVLDAIKNDFRVKHYFALKRSRRRSGDLGYYGEIIAHVSGICEMLIFDNIIGDNQIHELYDATKEYLNTKSSKRLDALFDEMRKGVEK
jgi:hypothetical protein